jgi:hypothetical protein
MILFCFVFSARAWSQSLRLEPLPALFCDEVFRDRVLQHYLPGLNLNCDPLISSSWVARITGMSHWHLAIHLFYDTFNLHWSYTDLIILSQIISTWNSNPNLLSFLDYPCKLGKENTLSWFCYMDLKAFYHVKKHFVIKEEQLDLEQGIILCYQMANNCHLELFLRISIIL